MSTATITSKGQTTIPKDIREYLHLGVHDKINFIPYDKGRVIIAPVKGTILDLKGILRDKIKGKVDFNLLREQLKSKIAKEIMGKKQ